MKKNINLLIDGIAPEKVMYDTDNHSLVVLYPAQREFKRGDILASDDKTLLIFDEYATYNKEKDSFHSLWNNFVNDNRYWTTKHFKHATDEQIAQLHEDLRKNGKRWNAETLQVEDLDISEIVVDLDSACDYLKIKRPLNFILYEACERSDKFEAQMELQLIREAWNKFDGFVIDYANSEQGKYFPVLDVCGDINFIASWGTTHISASCLSFPTQERALQFGNQFKELFKIALGL